MPALPLDEAGKYVAGAYVVFVALILVYVSVMASRLSRIERELEELDDIAEHRLEAGGSRGAGGGAMASEARAGDSRGDLAP